MHFDKIKTFALKIKCFFSNSKFNMFLADDWKQGNLSWYYFCFCYKLFNHKILKFLAKGFDKIIKKVFKNKLKKFFTRQQRFTRDLKALLLFSFGTYIMSLISDLVSLEIRKTLFIYLTTFGLFIYFVTPIFYLSLQTYRIRLQKYNFNWVAILCSIIYSILRIIINNIKNIFLGIAFCLNAAILTTLTIEKSIEVIKPLVVDFPEKAESITGLQFVCLSIYLMFVFVPLAYAFQGLLEKMDRRWEKVKLLNSSIFIQVFFWVVMAIGLNRVLLLESSIIEQVRIVAVFFTLSLYLIFIIANSYNMYRLSKGRKY